MFDVEPRVRRDIDPIWSSLKVDAEAAAAAEPALASFLHAAVMSHDTLEAALSFKL